MIRSEFQNVLVIMAHPDDAELGAGGSIARWAADGAVVRTVIVTNGDKGSKEDIPPHRVAEIREAEQLAASKVLGVKETIFLRHRDGDLEDTEALRNQFAFLIRHLKPDTVVTHDPWRLHYQHPDHQAIGHATFKAVIYARDQHFLPELTYAGIGPHHTNVLLYTSANEPNFYVDITGTIDKKIRAVTRHKSQLPPWRGTEKRSRERSREFGRRVGLAYAEGFAITRMR